MVAIFTWADAAGCWSMLSTSEQNEIRRLINASRRISAMHSASKSIALEYLSIPDINALIRRLAESPEIMGTAPTERSGVDQLIIKYADELRDIYDRQTAGDHTFTGVLFNFLMELDALPNVTINR